MVGQRKGALVMSKQIAETHEAALEEVAQLRLVADEIADLLKNLENRK
jgi:hypothetical protein